jgi:tripartite-type tricarboxylate transporter receptor subunit TctC
MGGAMKLARRKLLHFIAGAAALPAISRVATAQTYPSRPITMIVPFAPGGAADVVGRVVAERLGKSLGQPVIVENIAGADGTIGVGRAARARPDGYTICLGYTDTNVLNGAFYSLSYDVLGDLVPISPINTSSFFFFARKTMPAADLNEFVSWLKTNPNRASAGIITLGARLLTVLLQRETGMRFALVPYRGGAPAVQDLAAGQIDVLFAPAVFLPLARSGNIKVYAVTSDMRMTLVAPDIPTFTERGLSALSFSAWCGLFGPRGTPKDIVGKLNAVIVDALADPAVRYRTVELGAEIFPREQQTPEALGALVKADAAKWWPIVKEFGIKAE